MPSPVDPHRQWHDPRLVEAAVRWQRRVMHLPEPVKIEPASGPTAVRTNWRQIPPSAMTPAELALARAACDETMRRLRSENPRVADQVAAALGSPFGVEPAEEIFDDQEARASSA